MATVPEALALRDAGDEGPLLCWLTVPADVEDGSLARAIEQGVDVTAYTVAEPRPDRRHRTNPRVQLKVDTGLSRGGAALADWAAAGGARSRAREERPGSHHRRLVALRVQRRARPSGERRAAGPLRGGAADCPRRRSAARSAPPRELGRRDPAAQQPVRRGARRPGVVRPRPRPRHPPRHRPPPGDDRARPARPEQADHERRGRLLRPHLGRPRGHDGGPGAGRVRRRRTASRQQRARGRGRRRTPPGTRPGLHGPGRRRPARRPPRARHRGRALRPR